MPFMPGRLRQARKDRNLRQIDLAASLGLSDRTIRDYEKGVHEPNGEHLSMLSRVLDINPDWLFGLADDPTPKEALSPDERRLIKALRIGDYDTVSRLILQRKAKNNPKKDGALGRNPGSRP